MGEEVVGFANDDGDDQLVYSPIQPLPNIPSNLQMLAAQGPQTSDKHRFNLCCLYLSTIYAVSSETHAVSRPKLTAEYELFCKQVGVAPVNTSSLGKALKASFPGVVIRRLGIRGSSTYHYCGLRKKPEYFSVPLANDIAVTHGDPMVRALASIYRTHCESVKKHLQDLNPGAVLQCSRGFWSKLDVNFVKYLCETLVIAFILKCDADIYDVSLLLKH